MKLSEIVKPKEEFEIDNPQKLAEFLLDNRLTHLNIDFVSTGKVNSRSELEITDIWLDNNGELKIPFGIAGSNFIIATDNLTSFKGFPDRTTGTIKFGTSNINKLKSLDNFKTEGSLQIFKLPGDSKSLLNIENQITKIRYFSMDFSSIEEGGIGLILAPLMRGIRQFNNDGLEVLPTPFRIIQKYIGRPDDIFDCQEELIDNGYEAYARI